MRETTHVISAITQPYAAPSLQRLDPSCTESSLSPSGDDGVLGGNAAS